MKKIISLLCTFFVAGLAIAQTVTINVTGNRNKQVTVDGQVYSINNTTTSSEQDVVISNLATGQHTLQVSRINPNTNRTTNTNTTFTLREGYDLDITVNNNGAVSLTEKRAGRNGNNNGTAIGNAAFNKLYTTTQQKTSSTARASYLSNEFTNTNKYFTASQASKLIKLVNSESLRFNLAKQSYTRITDEENFSLVANLLNSSANRSALNTYIASLPSDDDDETGTVGVPMTDERFKVIYNEVFAEYSSTDKNYYLVNFFSKDYNYFTSSQARQLIQLVPMEAERLHLAKLAYRGVTDRTNYQEVVQLLNSSSSRSELNTYIASYSTGGTGVGVAMSSTDFNRLYQTIYYQNANTRYTSINTAFATPGYYFTSAQARQLVQLVTNESSRLILAKASYKVLTDRANYTVFNSLLTSQANRADLADYVQNFNSYGAGTGVNVPMTDANFNQLYRSVADAWSTTSRYNLINSAFQTSNNYFTTTQARQLLVLINSESDRLALAKISYDNLTDQYNYAVMSDLFTSSTNKNEWVRYTTQYTGGTVVKVAMTDSEFTSLQREIQFTFGLGAKMSRLTTIFNTETNYFTAQQARQLIQMVSAESNRLELAKLSYNNLTDPANYTIYNDIFEDQASRDELRVYVQNNAYLNN